MALRESGLTGRNVQETCEGQTGLLMQPPDSMTQERDGTTLTVIPTTVGGNEASDSNVEFGSPFVIHMGVSAGQDAGGGDNTYNFRVFGIAGSPFKFRVLLPWVHTQGADGQDGTLSLYHYTLDSDGALDTGNLMSDAAKFTGIDADDLAAFGIVNGTSKLIEAYAVILAGQELVARILTSDASEGEEYSIKLLCMRIN